MFKATAVFTLLLLAVVICEAKGKDPKNYPIQLRFVSTSAVDTGQLGSRTETSCKPGYDGDQVNCTSRPVAGGTHYTYVSTVVSPDGTQYDVVCRVLGGRGFLAGFGQGMAAQSGASSFSGCKVPPGTYQARSDGGQFKVLTPRGKEVTFDVISSRASPYPISPVASPQAVATVANAPAPEPIPKPLTQLPSPQSKEAYIGSVRLVIGMPRQNVESELVPYKFTVSGNADFIEDKDGNDKGMLIFKGGLLSVISSTLYQKPIGKQDFAESLYNVIHSLMEQSGPICEVNAITPEQSGNANAKGFDLRCSGKRIAVMLSTDASGQQLATISESVGDGIQ